MSQLVNTKYDAAYRYACPDCGSHSVYENLGKHRVAGKSYRADGVGQKRAREDAGKRFRCVVCGERKAGVWDKKHGVETARPGE